MTRWKRILPGRPASEREAVSVQTNCLPLKLGIDPNPEFLVLFLRNLLLNESNELKNQVLHADWKEGLQETTQETAVTNEEWVLKLLEADPKMTLTEVAKQIGLSRRSIQKITDQLKSRGILHREGSTKAGKWIVTR